jgi:hypothetical protein
MLGKLCSKIEHQKVLARERLPTVLYRKSIVDVPAYALVQDLLLVGVCRVIV